MSAPYFDPEDIQKNKAMGGLGYLFFFVPMLTCPNSQFGRFCANQGLLFLLMLLVIRVAFAILIFALGWIPFVRWLFRGVESILMSGLLLLDLYYVITAMSGGDAKEFPVIGSVRILK